jgi:hypothetical protein
MVADNRPEIATKLATKWRWPARRWADSALDAQPPIRNHRPAYQLGSEPSPPDGFDLQGPQVMGPFAIWLETDLRCSGGAEGI